jgi:O-antigen/teichoic acid export membrane protein
MRLFLARFGQWWSAQDLHIVELLRGASIAGFMKALAAVLTFGLTVVVGRLLGVDATGVFFLALTTATIAATIGQFGMENTVLRFVAARASEDDWGDVSAVYRTTLGIGLICSGSVAAILYFASDFLANTVFSDPTISIPIRIMAIAVVPLCLSVLVSQALLGLSRIRDAVLVVSILPTGIALGGTWLLAPSWAVNGAIVAYVFAVIAALVYGCIVWYRVLSKCHSVHQSQPRLSLILELLSFSIPLLIGALLQLVMQLSGRFMLGVWADNADVGQYAVAWRTAMLISFVLLAFNTISQPMFAKLYTQGEMESLAATAHKATLLMTICATPVFLILFIAPEFVMSIFGSGFAGGASTLQILSVGQFINVVTGCVGVLVVMSGNVRAYRNIQVIVACVVLSLNILLIPAYGAVGAAIAAACALIVQNILFGYVVWNKLGILMIDPRFLVR